MPKPHPDGAITRIREFMATDTRQWTAAELGRHLGLTTHQTANTLIYLANRGEVLRTRHSRTRSTYRGVPGLTKETA